MADSKIGQSLDDAGDGPPYFSARLEPHRSLSQRGFAILLAVLAGISFVVGISFWLAGAWPVVGFLGVDLILLWLAFRLNFRAGNAFEEISVWRHDLLVRKVSPAGRVAEHRFNPFGTRFVVNRENEAGIVRMALAARGRELTIGGFLNPDDRESFAREFGQALATVKRR